MTPHLLEIEVARLTDELGAAQNKYDLLVKLLRANGFDVQEGDFIRSDGSHSPLYVFPADPRQLAICVVQAFNYELRMVAKAVYEEEVQEDEIRRQRR